MCRVSRRRGALGATGPPASEVFFNEGHLDPCASIAQISKSTFLDGAPGPGEAASNQGEDFDINIDVRTFNSAGTPTDLPFTVHVLCPEGEGGAESAASVDRGRR